MRYNPTFQRWSPESTPPAVRNVVWITACVSIFATLLHNFFHFLHIMSPVEFFGLSLNGLKSFFLWQPLTYMFVQEPSPTGIGFVYLMTLLVSLYIIWLIGTMVAERAGSRHFLLVYFLSGILAGLAALLVMQMTGVSSLITGPGAAILAICMIWTMYYADSEITLFFLFPIQAKWLMGGVLGAVCLLSIAEWDLPSLVEYLVGALFGYFYGLTVLNLQGPFEITKRFDQMVDNIGDKIRSKVNPNAPPRSSKIIDLRGHEVVDDDDAFVDTMLAKIAKHGEHALTQSERARMQKISERKAQERNK